MNIKLYILFSFIFVILVNKPVFAIETKITQVDETNDVYYLDMLEGPTERYNVDFREGYDNIDIENANFDIDINTGKVIIKLDLLDTPIVNSSFSYETEIVIEPFDDETDTPIVYAQIYAILFGIHENRTVIGYNGDMKDGTSFTEMFETNYTIVDTIITWETTFTDFPFDEVFVEDNTYYTLRADTLYYGNYTDNTVNSGQIPVLMDRLEYIPDWVLAEDENDGFNDIIEELPINLSSVFIAISTSLIFKNSKSPVNKLKSKSRK